MSNVVKKKCTGCIEGSFCYNLCNIVPYSIKHGCVEYCFECGQYHCDKYDKIENHDSTITHINQKADMQKAKTIGIEKYNQEQS